MSYNADVLDELRRIVRKLDRLIALTGESRSAEGKILMTLDDLKAKVEAQTTVVGSAVTLLGELKALLDAAIAAGDMVKVQEIADMIDAETASLAAAVTANTPAA